ncbi:hypothetical protein, partial [Nitrosopumilus sp.]|uniref:hypothetical protein n=1 Tax=Nitrosopumilus sp. TaxID=2024843 RepID=UPI00247EF2B4
MSETSNDSFRIEMVAEIKKIQSELNELKAMKRNIAKTPSKRKPAKKTVAKKKAVKRKPAKKTVAKKKAVKRKP